MGGEIRSKRDGEKEHRKEKRTEREGQLLK